MCGHKKNADRKPIIKLKALVSPCYNNRKQPALSIYIGTHPRKDFEGWTFLYQSKRKHLLFTIP